MSSWPCYSPKGSGKGFHQELAKDVMEQVVCVKNL